MIGRALHSILKNNLDALATGGIYPVVMPQKSYKASGNITPYPAIIYSPILEYETSKDLAN